MSIVSIRNAIHTIITSLESSLTFDDTYYEMPTEIETLPVVALILNGGGEEYSSTGQNAMGANFTVRAMVEKTDSSDDDVTQTNKLLNLVDGLMNELRKKEHATLSGNTHSMIIVDWTGIEVGSIGNTIVFYVDIFIETQTFKSVT